MLPFYGDVLQAGVSCLLVIGVGYLLSKFNVFTTDEFKVFNSFNSKVCLPFLLFRSLASQKMKDITFLPLLNALLMSASTQLLVGIISAVFPFKDKLGMYLSTVISSAYINYIIIGLPIFNSIWGTEYNHIPAICVFTHYVLLVPLYTILAGIWRVKQSKKSASIADNEEGDKDPKAKSKAPAITCKDIGLAFYTAIKQPLLIGNIIGLIWSAIGIDYYPFFKVMSKYIGDVVLVFALICIGRFLQVNSLLSCKWLHLVLCLFIRCFVCPGFSALYAYAFKFNGRLARQCIVLSSLPAANAGFVLSSEMGIGANVASAMVFWSLIIIVPVLIFWFFILNHFNLFPEEGTS